MITQVEENSIASELGIEPGDRLISINDRPVKDVFDYRFLQKDESLTVLIEKSDGEEWELSIEKDEDEELGLVFETGLMDEPSSCRNKCVFCFIDQLPPGLRKTLYFKDDDARLGFLSGNYVTLTNISDEELERVIYYRLSPVNISVHATDPELRVQMLKNPNAAKIMGQIQKLCDAGLTVNFQIVLCKGVNDGARLDESIAALAQFRPQACSLSVVPVGLTKYRNGLPLLAPFSAADANVVLDQIEGWQRRLKAKGDDGSVFVYAADEFYLLSGRKPPPAAAYDGFPQIENGVGMLALFAEEFTRALKRRKRPPRDRALTAVTGTAAHGFLTALAARVTDAFPDFYMRVIAVENRFFGETVTVSGLLTGRDILTALCETAPHGRVLLPRNALRAGDSVFLDDMELADLARALETTVSAVDTTGGALIKAIFEGDPHV